MSFRVGGRDVYLVAGAKAVSLLGDEMATLALMLRLQANGAAAAAVAGLLIANLLPIVALSAIVGRLIDRVDSRWLLLTSSLAQAAVCVVLSTVTATPATFALVALLGAGQAVNGSTWHSLLPAIVAPDELPRAISLSQVATTGAGIVAPALSGLLTGVYGARVPLLVDSATFLAITAAAVLLRTRRASGGARATVGGFALVRRDPLLRPVFILLALFVALGSMVNVVDVFLVRETLSASAVWYGLAAATYAAGALAGALLGGRLAGVASLARWFVVSCCAVGLGLVAMGSVPNVAWLLPAGAATGLANGLLNVTLGALVMGRAAPEARGRIGAMLVGTASGMQLAAYAAGGALAVALTPREVFMLGGSLGLLAPLLLGGRLLRAVGRTADSAAWPSGGESLPQAASRAALPAT